MIAVPLIISSHVAAMKTAFIGYATKDQDAARSIKNMLEERGISCWIAPDEITPGKEYAEEF